MTLPLASYVTLQAMWPSHFTSLSLSLLTCKIRIIIISWHILIHVPHIADICLFKCQGTHEEFISEEIQYLAHAMKGRCCHIPLWQGIHRPADFPAIHSNDQLSTDYGLGTVLASEYDFIQYKCSLLSWALSLMGVTSTKQIIILTAQFPSQVIAMRDMCTKLCKPNSNGFWFEGREDHSAAVTWMTKRICQKEISAHVVQVEALR